MIRSLFRIIFMPIKLLWRFVDFLRRSFFNLVFLALLLLTVLFFIHGGDKVHLPSIEKNTALVIHPSGQLVEAQTLENPLALFDASAQKDPETVLHDTLNAIQQASTDSNISALIIETDDLNSSGLSKTGELRQAINRFKKAGKPVYAYATFLEQSQYQLASTADQLHLDPDGLVLINGLAIFTPYFKKALDTLGIKIHVFKVGEYKSFSEPFTRTEMSDEDRQSKTELLADLWTSLKKQLAQNRKLSEQHFQQYADHPAEKLIESQGNGGLAALNDKLVDKLSTPDEWEEFLNQTLAVEGETEYRHITTNSYLKIQAAKKIGQRQPKVAVLVAQGNIVDGEAGPEAVGGETLAQLIKDTREDDDVKAIVLRIDSPGGSAFASEQIRRELALTRAAGKPVIASMSSVAASGGYWIATGAQEIWAHPDTITGSIGIFALFPEISEPLSQLGITMDGVSTSASAGMLDPRRPLSDQASRTMQALIDHGYQRFLEVVSKARNMSTTEVDAIARGRVWSGQMAYQHKLVDHLGGLDDAVQAAAAAAKLDHYAVVWPEPNLSFAQNLLRTLGQGSAQWLPASWHQTLVGIVQDMTDTSSPSARLMQHVEKTLNQAAQWNDPKNLYAHCLCEPH